MAEKRWFCRFTAFEITPDHPFFCRFRNSIGTKGIELLFKIIVNRSKETVIMRSVLGVRESRNSDLAIKDISRRLFSDLP